MHIWCGVVFNLIFQVANLLQAKRRRPSVLFSQYWGANFSYYSHKKFQSSDVQVVIVRIP